MSEHTPKSPQLPALVMTVSDVSRLTHELVSLDNYMHQQKIRTPGQPMAKMPKTTRMLDELAVVNGVNLLEPAAREYLAVFLQQLAAHAPVVHISFAVDPSSAFLQKIVLWFRKNTDPHVLVRVGLQPSLAAGCVVRTPNKYFDMSLRQHLQKRRPLLRDAVAALGKIPAQAPVAPEPTQPQQPAMPAVGQGVAA
ncbi:MAG TPA: F0F1 ATP synthase subunit delta [Candidatus Saccharimonadales bacterium]|nr:F0F1 ATP synthase subunit delta [Candidatus Saccharimonadales bacterium]